MIAALTMVAALGLTLGSVVVARHRAQAAADLAALAAASGLTAGPGEACARAGEIVAAMGAQMPSCVVAELDVIVSVAVRAGSRFGGVARAAARAGPVTRRRPG